jgi:mono/diheme cytochrome c family protein
MIVRVLILTFVAFLISKERIVLADTISSFQVLQASGICPQNRKTQKAPGRYLKKKNPVPITDENIAKGQRLFNKDAKPTACKLCHGFKGNGNGSLARRMEPPPRNFTCAEVMKDLPAGQLFCIIQNGSRGTAMPAHKSTLKPEEIWQLILFIKNFLRA